MGLTEFDFSVVVHRRAGWDGCIVAVTGEVDMNTAPAFEQKLLDAIQEGERVVVIDLSATTFIDSTFLSSLVGGRAAAPRPRRIARRRLRGPGVVKGLHDHRPRPAVHDRRDGRRCDRHSPQSTDRSRGQYRRGSGRGGSDAALGGGVQLRRLGRRRIRRRQIELVGWVRLRNRCRRWGAFPRRAADRARSWSLA